MIGEDWLLMNHGMEACLTALPPMHVALPLNGHGDVVSPFYSSLPLKSQEDFVIVAGRKPLANGVLYERPGCPYAEGVNR
jgi:hypothetical protein